MKNLGRAAAVGSTQVASASLLVAFVWRQTLSTHIQYDLATRSLPDSASPTIRSDRLELACLEGLNVKEGT